MIDVKINETEFRMTVEGSTAQLLFELTRIIRKTYDAVNEKNPDLGEQFKQLISDPSYFKDVVFSDDQGTEGGETLRWTMKL